MASVSRLGHRSALAVLAGAVVLALAIVDPFREFLTQDDGWAYARTVERLLATGEYRLDDWAAANMPVQIYLTAGLAEVLGYSLSLLRLPTLALLALAVGSLYGLLTELRLRPGPAALLAAGLLASPLTLLLSFTFMSDVQFLGWMTAALWLYVRAERRQSGATLLLASLMAACAIGTRQFGIALIGGWLGAHLLSRGFKPSISRTLLALALPMGMAAWQVRAGLAEPTFTQAVRLDEQAYYLARPPLELAREAGWRVSMLLQYLGLAMAPLLPLLGFLGVSGVFSPEGGRPGRRSLGPLIAAAMVTAALVGFAALGSSLTARPGAGLGLPLYWLLPNAYGSHERVVQGLWLAGVLGAFFLTLLSLQAWRGLHALRRIPAAWLICLGTAGGLAGLHLVYVQFNDTYVLAFLPMALLAPTAALLRGGDLPRAAVVASWLACGLAILLICAHLRGQYNRQEAQWAAADALLAAGISPRCVGASRHWSEYHGAFDDWIEAAYPAFDHARGDVPGDWHQRFYAAMDTAPRSYLVAEPWAGGPGEWEVLDRVEYRTALGRTRQLLTFRRRDGGGCELEVGRVQLEIPPARRGRAP